MVSAGNLASVQAIRAALVKQKIQIQATVDQYQAALDATTARIAQMDQVLVSALSADQEAALFLAMVKAGT
jgi:hypothetical protein